MKTISTILMLVGAWAVPVQAQNYETNNVMVQTFAGSGFYGYVDGVGQQTMFYGPAWMVADSSSNLFVVDINNLKIRKITPDGTVSTFATNYGYIGSIAIDRSNMLWVPNFYGNRELTEIRSDGSAVSVSPLSGVSSPNSVCVD